MINRFQVCIAVFLTLALAPRNYAAPLSIELLAAHCTTTVSTINWSGWTNDSRTTDSSVPCSDSLFNAAYGSLMAKADAELFHLAAFSRAERRDPDRGVYASAKSELTFTPLASASTTLSLEFFGNYEWFFSEGFVSLLDVTTDETMWNYAWHAGSGTVPWTEPTVPDPDGWRARATLALETDFIAGHNYELTLFTEVGSQAPDAELIQIQVSGLSIPPTVPEPSTMTLTGLGFGFAAWLAGRRRRLLVAD